MSESAKRELIKRLYVKSLDDSQQFCYQRFAELIIKECGFYLLEHEMVDIMDVIALEQHFDLQ